MTKVVRQAAARGAVENDFGALLSARWAEVARTEPHRFTYEGQEMPWCDPIDPPDVEAPRKARREGGLSPMEMRDLVVLAEREIPAPAASTLLGRFSPQILSLRDPAWTEWVRTTALRLAHAT